MLLIAAILILGLAVVAGTWLAGQYILNEAAPAGLGRAGLLHGMSGLAGFAILIAALTGHRPSAHAAKMGAAGFGIVAAGLLGAALLAGLLILGTHLRRRGIPLTLVATHGLLAITGYTLLVTYLTLLR